jgi:hypothetical protein
MRKGLTIETRAKLLADIAAATESLERAINRLRLADADGPTPPEDVTASDV